ncbi:MAG TPA: pyrroloquinoline quinone-dependent dehydrogenase [Caulobacteraceae bacterium]|nr:pyrroloquinoline quinone-dependent dehydrogenase [Caulobacteraceae bacterium]
MRCLKLLLPLSALFCSSAGVAAAANTASQTTAPDSYETSSEWPTYGHDAGGMRFSPLNQITPSNVATLKPAWIYHLKPRADNAGAARASGIPDESAAPAPRPAAFGGGFSPSEDTPLVVGGIMYIASPYGRVVALDAVTGKEVWVYALAKSNPSTRGVEYFPGDATTPALIVVGTEDSRLFTLDAKTGALNTRFGDNGFVKLDKPPTSPPVTYKNIVIVGGRDPETSGPGPSGDVNAYDLHDGKLVWTFHTIPHPGEPNYGKTWVAASADQRSGVNAWGGMSVDLQRGIVYLPLGAPSGDLFGGDRPGNNLYDTSLVAVDARTGKYIWHFQAVHHDVWDYDLESVALFDIRRGGRTIPALSVVGKNGLLFLLDRTTGKPIYGVQERRVPASDVPGEKLSPTQPFPVKPAPLARNTMSEKDMNTVTPELAAACRKFVADNGIVIDRPPFAPNLYNRSGVVFPSEIGGANWGGASFNPALGLLFVNVNELGQVIGAKTPASGPVDLATLVGNKPGSRQGPYGNFGPSGRFAVRDPALGLIPCTQPPWGSLVAIDVNTGAIAWKSPLGLTEGLPENLNKTGRPNIGGSIATAGGLVFIGGTDDSRFRAFDAKTGQEVWTVKLDASVSATPSTYLGKDGRQYVVAVATGGSNSGAPIRSDEIVAFATN